MTPSAEGAFDVPDFAPLAGMTPRAERAFDVPDFAPLAGMTPSAEQVLDVPGFAPRLTLSAVRLGKRVSMRQFNCRGVYKCANMYMCA